MLHYIVHSYKASIKHQAKNTSFCSPSTEIVVLSRNTSVNKIHCHKLLHLFLTL